MAEFTRGVVFTVGMFMFGHGMYKLGRMKEADENVKQARKLAAQMDILSKTFRTEESQ